MEAIQNPMIKESDKCYPQADMKKQVKTEQEIKKEKLPVDKVQQECLIEAIEKASGEIKSTNKELSFSIHEKTNQIMVKVLDKETKEIVREIPSEKVLDMIANMLETAGIFVDAKR